MLSKLLAFLVLQREDVNTQRQQNGEMPGAKQLKNLCSASVHFKWTEAAQRFLAKFGCTLSVDANWFVIRLGVTPLDVFRTRSPGPEHV